MSEVQLNFTDATGLEAFEKQFSLAFPKLRVHLVRDRGNLKRSHPSTALEITGQTTVEQLEEEFKQRFSIRATIFRLTGGIWIAVKQTRDWNLNDQNLEGSLV